MLFGEEIRYRWSELSPEGLCNTFSQIPSLTAATPYGAFY